MLDGILVMDKAFGITSFQMVQEVRKRLKVKKAGHAGTLDPLGTGVLPICLGRATKIVQFIMAGHKVYQGTMLLGVATDTYDAMVSSRAYREGMGHDAAVSELIRCTGTQFDAECVEAFVKMCEEEGIK